MCTMLKTNTLLSLLLRSRNQLQCIYIAKAQTPCLTMWGLFTLTMETAPLLKGCILTNNVLHPQAASTSLYHHFMTSIQSANWSTHAYRRDALQKYTRYPLQHYYCGRQYVLNNSNCYLLYYYRKYCTRSLIICINICTCFL